MFPTTNWTMLAQATLDGNAAGREALQALCGRYRPVVLQFVRRRGLPPEDAEDATQDFFQNLITSRMWSRAQRGHGRFRSFLCAALVNRLHSRTRDAMRKKRGGGSVPVSLDAMLEAGSALELAVPAEEVMAFDAEWAAELLNQALALVESAFVEQGKSQRFAVLRSFLPGGGEAPSQSSAAEMLGISENTLRIDLTRLRGKLREALRAEIARTVSAPHEIDTEMSHLIAVLLHQPAV